MQKLRQHFIILVFILPLLLSFSSVENIHKDAFASYKSPEGIHFISYSDKWDYSKLQGLYQELKKNKHGEEFRALKKVTVLGGALDTSLTKGAYYALTKSIVLYQGDKYTSPVSYRKTLSHEYGHHFAYYYFPSHHLPFSEWSIKRGLDVTKVRWDAFWNYNDSDHAYYPQEIFANDYVLLYGATTEVDAKKVLTNEAFYLRTEHENQSLPNVLENHELHQLLEKESGLAIDEERLLYSPKDLSFGESNVTFSNPNKPNVAYRLNLTFHNEIDSYGSSENYELYKIVQQANGHLDFSLEELDTFALTNYEYVTANLDVLDLSTSIGFETNQHTVKLK